MIRRKLFFGFFMAMLFSCASAFAEPHFIIFGDSLSDSGMNEPSHDLGNNDWVKTPSKTGAPITNADPRTGTHPLWINQLVHILLPGQTLYTVNAAKAKNVDPTLHNVNYAYASAETGDHYLNDISGEPFPPYVDNICNMPGKINENTACVPGIAKQIQSYLDKVHHPTSDTVFIIWAGGNDILNNITKTMSFFSRQGMKKVSAAMLQPLNRFLPARGWEKSEKIYTFSEVIPELSDPIVNLYLAKEKLIAAGASPAQIYVINLPDLAKSPAGIRLSGGNPAVLQAIHAISAAFNEALALALTGNPLSDSNLPATHILSMYDFLNEVTKNPDKYQMTNLTGSCARDNKTPFCKGYVFFDDKHPTVNTGKIMAEWIAGKMAAQQ